MTAVCQQMMSSHLFLYLDYVLEEFSDSSNG